MNHSADANQLLAALTEEPWHMPHTTHALTARHLDAKQRERETATTPLGELLLASGAVEGPFKRPHPITRWRLLGRRISQALAAIAR